MQVLLRSRHLNPPNPCYPAQELNSAEASMRLNNANGYETTT